MAVIETGYDRNFALARYNSDGSLDTSFGGDGLVTTDFGAMYDFGYSVAIDGNGKILVAGTSFSDQFHRDSDFALARYNSDGSLDTGFGADGLVTTDFGSGLDEGYSVAIDRNGKIVVTGVSSQTGTRYDFALARYNSDGSLDTFFDGDGLVTTDFGANSGDWGQSVAIDRNGNIVVAGRSYVPGRHYDCDQGVDTSNPDTNYHGWLGSVVVEWQKQRATAQGGPVLERHLPPEIAAHPIQAQFR